MKVEHSTKSKTLVSMDPCETAQGAEPRASPSHVLSDCQSSVSNPSKVTLKTEPRGKFQFEIHSVYDSENANEAQPEDPENRKSPWIMVF